MVVANVDWQAVSAVASGVAALITAYLAWATWKMAGATRAMAQEAGHQADAAAMQAEASQRLAAIAERQLGIDESQLEALSQPRLRVNRWGEMAEAAVEFNTVDDEVTNLLVQVHNIGEARAEFGSASAIVDGVGNFAGQLGITQGRIIEPDERFWTIFTLSDAQSRQVLAGKPVVHTLSYGAVGEPATEQRVTTIKAKDEGQRWLVVEERAG